MGEIRQDNWTLRLHRTTHRTTWCLATQDSYNAIQRRYRTRARTDTEWYLRFEFHAPTGYHKNKISFLNLNVEEYNEEQKTMIDNSHKFVKLFNPDHQIGTPFDKVNKLCIAHICLISRMSCKTKSTLLNDTQMYIWNDLEGRYHFYRYTGAIQVDGSNIHFVKCMCYAHQWERLQLQTEADGHPCDVWLEWDEWYKLSYFKYDEFTADLECHQSFVRLRGTPQHRLRKTVKYNRSAHISHPLSPDRLA